MEVSLPTKITNILPHENSRYTVAGLLLLLIYKHLSLHYYYFVDSLLVIAVTHLAALIVSILEVYKAVSSRSAYILMEHVFIVLPHLRHH